MDMYDRQKVPEYWMLDWEAGEVLVYRRVGESLQRVAALRRGDVLQSPLLPGFACPVAELFEGLEEPEGS